MTKTEWFAFAMEHRQEIIGLIADYHPTARPAREIPEGVTDLAENAEAACAVIREKIAHDTPAGTEAATVLFSKALDAKDGDTIMRILWETWFGVPESQAFAWSLVGFKEIIALMDGVDDEQGIDETSDRGDS